MLVRDALEVRIAAAPGDDDRAGRVRLPKSLKSDRTRVRTAMMQRLAASRLFAIGPLRHRPAARPHPAILTAGIVPQRVV